MKKLAILSPLVILMASTSLAQDSCIVRPSCADMGYTKTIDDCTGKTTLKCPFDLSAVSCEDEDSSSGSGQWDWENVINCIDLGFTVSSNLVDVIAPCGGCVFSLDPNSAVRFGIKDVSGNQLLSQLAILISGAVNVCVDKGFTITTNIGVLNSSTFCYFIPYKGEVSFKDSSSCEVGDYYLEDNTCVSYPVRRAIGVVIDAKNRKIASLKPTASTKFATSLSDYESVYSSLTSTTDGKGNTNKLIAAGVDKFPAAKYCNDLTDGGKSWYLPATDEIVVPQTLATKINISLSSSVTSSAKMLTSTSRDATYIDCKYVNKEGTTSCEANIGSNTQFVLCVAKY